MNLEGKLILAIDTATATTGIALFDGRLVSEHTWRSGPNQTMQLLPAITWMLERQSFTIGDVGALAVSLGPGSFNGLRVGISAAKGLAIALALPCFGIGLMEATAYQFVNAMRGIRPIYDAGRGEVATALYRPDGGALQELEEPRLTSISQLADEIAEATLICGELRPAWQVSLFARAGDLVAFPPAAAMGRRPAFLAELGWHRWEAGDRFDIAGMEPLYLRRPAITPPKGSATRAVHLNLEDNSCPSS